MMICTLLLSVFFAIFPLTAVAKAPACHSQSPTYCNGTANNATLQYTYVCGDYRLGPIRLPRRPVLESLVSVYDRFGGLCPGPFLAAWYNTTSNGWNYPLFSGFQLDNNGYPIVGNMTLPVGMLVDRFGSEYGTFMSPAASPYEAARPAAE